MARFEAEEGKEKKDVVRKAKREANEMATRRGGRTREERCVELEEGRKRLGGRPNGR